MFDTINHILKTCFYYSRLISFQPLSKQAMDPCVTSPPLLPARRPTSHSMDHHRQIQDHRGTSPGVSLKPPANGHPCTSRHTRPAGVATIPVQDAPLDLTKPMDLSLKSKRTAALPQPNGRGNTNNNNIISSNTCQRFPENHIGGAVNGRAIPAVVTPYNFTNTAKPDASFVPIQPHRKSSNGCTRRTGLLASSPRNYNYKGRAVVAPRKEQPERSRDGYHHQQISEQANSMLPSYSMQSHSVPYSAVSFTPLQTITPSSSSSYTHMLPIYSLQDQNRALQQQQPGINHKPILQKPSAASIQRPSALARPIVSDTPSRVAHVTALGYSQRERSTPAMSSAQGCTSFRSGSGQSASHRLNVDPNHTTCTQQNSLPGHQSWHVNNFHSNSLSSGTISSHHHEQKKLPRAHSVNPMHPSRNTYAKGINRQNIPVLKMLQSSIAAAIKLKCLLKPIDGPGLDSSSSSSSSFFPCNKNAAIPDAPLKESNNGPEPSATSARYNRPLQVDIPEQHQHATSTPPNLTDLFNSELSGPPPFPLGSRCHQLSPPPVSTNPNDRVSPTMPVLVPHKMYSPVEPPSSANNSDPSGLPVLKNAKLERNGAGSEPGPLPFLSPAVEPKKVQCVSPVLSEPRRIDERQPCPRHSPWRHEHHQKSSSAGRTMDVYQNRVIDGRTRREFENMLAQMNRKSLSTPSSLEQAKSANSAPTSPGAGKHLETSVVRNRREEAREIFRKMMRRQKRELASKKSLLADFFIGPKSEPPSDSEPDIIDIYVPPKKEPELVDLTSSPTPSPEAVVKPETDDDDGVVHTIPNTGLVHETSYGNISAHPDLKEEVRRSHDSNKHPCPQSVMSDLTSLKEAVQAATLKAVQAATLRAASQSTESNCTNVKNCADNSSSKTNFDQAVSLLMDSGLPKDASDEGALNTPKSFINTMLSIATSSIEAEVKTQTHKSYCPRHRRILFSSPNDKSLDSDVNKTTKQREKVTATIADVINEHFLPHDPRKKHLASMTHHGTKVERSLEPKSEADSEPVVNAPKDNERVVPLAVDSANSLTGDDAEEAEGESTAAAAAESNEDSDLKPAPRKLNLEMNRIANTSSYVADFPKKPKTGDLLVDSSLLDREERALQVSLVHVVSCRVVSCSVVPCRGV